MRKLAIVAGMLMLCSAAYAQDEEEGVGGMEAEADVGGAMMDSAAPAESPAAETTATTTVGVYTKTTYPDEVIKRGFVVPKGMIEVEPTLGYVNLSMTMPTPTGPITVSASALGLGVHARYGIIDKLEAGLGLSLFQLTIPDEGDSDTSFIGSSDNRSLTLDAGYQVLASDKMFLAPRLSLPFHFEEDADALPGVVLGADFQYNVMPKLAVFAGHGLLRIAFADSATTDLTLNVGVGYQLNPKVWLRFDTMIVSFVDAFDSTVAFGADVIPINLTGLYVVNRNLDAFAQFNVTDMGEFADTFAFIVGANYRL